MEAVLGSSVKGKPAVSSRDLRVLFCAVRFMTVSHQRATTSDHLTQELSSLVTNAAAKATETAYAARHHSDTRAISNNQPETGEVVDTEGNSRTTKLTSDCPTAAT